MNCDYWGDYMWEVVAFVIIIVIGIFYLIGTYFGAGAVILVIGAIVFGFYKFLRFLYKGIIIKHNKTEPTYTKTSLFLCEKRRFFMARTEKGVVATI